MKKRPVGGNPEIRRFLAGHRILENASPPKPLFLQILLSILLYVLLPLGTAWLVSAAVNSHNQFMIGKAADQDTKQQDLPLSKQGKN